MAKSRQKKYVTLIIISSVLQPTHSPMCFSPQNRLDERWGAETSAKGTRFKLNRDMSGYFLSNRAAIEIDEGEPPVKVVIDNPEKLRTAGNLVHLDNVAIRFKGAEKPLFEGVTLTVGQGGRCAFVGAVS